MATVTACGLQAAPPQEPRPNSPRLRASTAWSDGLSATAAVHAVGVVWSPLLTPWGAGADTMAFTLNQATICGPPPAAMGCSRHGLSRS
jgi:hypothetical protein